MAITYLNSQMIEIPAAIADLSAVNLSADNLLVSNLIATNVSVPSFGDANEWNQAYTLVKSNSASWEESTDITAITTTVAVNSGKWENVYNDVGLLSGTWQSNYNTVKGLSSTWQSTFQTVDSLSGTWESVYQTVSALSASWEESTEVVPSVLNYISANNIQVQDITLSETGSLIFNSAEIFGNVVIHGSLSALSGGQIYQNITTVTSSLSVQNYGPGPGLYVFQDTSLESIVQVKGADNVDIFTVNNVSLDQGQDGVKIYFTGLGNTFVVGNSSNNTAFVVTSAGNINTTGQILSGNTPLHNIFLTSETDSQNLTYDETTYDLSISNGNTVNLSSINTTVANTSARWEDVYNTVSALSGTWDLVTVTNYLSTELVTVSSLNVTNQLLSAGTDLFNIFLTQETDSQTLTYNELTYDLVITNGNTVNLSSVNNTILPTVTSYLLTSVVNVSTLSATDTITTNLVILSTQQIPTLSTDSGTKGTLRWDLDYFYICIETDTWKRVALSSW